MRRRTLLIALVALLVLVTAGIVAYSVSLRRSIEDQSYIPQDVPLTKEMLLLQRYVRLDTTNPPGNELAGARLLAAELKEAGVPSEIILSAPGRANVYARIRGKERGGGLLLLNHIDVVKAEAADWTYPPFSGDVRLGMMWGRGTLDMKGIAVCQLAAFVEIAKSGQVPAHDIVFLAVSDEEAASEAGMKWLLAHRPDVIDGIAYAVNEGGITEMVAGKVRYFGVEIGSKQFARIRLEADTPEPLQRARILLEPHFSPRDPDAVPDAVRTYFAQVSTNRTENAELLRDIDRTIAAGKFWLLPNAYRVLTTNEIVAAGIERAGSRYILDVTATALPGQSLQASVDRTLKLLGVHGARHSIVRWLEAPETSSPDSPFYRLIETTTRKVHGPVPAGVYVLPFFTTDSRLLRVRGIDAYGVWPFLVDFHQTQGIHGIDERVTLTRFREGVTYMKELVTAFAQQ